MTYPIMVSFDTYQRTCDLIQSEIDEFKLLSKSEGVNSFWVDRMESKIKGMILAASKLVGEEFPAMHYLAQL